MIEEKLKSAFWDVVIECLVQFHSVALEEARRMTMDLSISIENPPLDLSSEMFYHSEPFDVACDLAKKPLQIAEYRGKYNQILELNHL